MIGNRFSAAAATYDRHARPQLALAQSVVSVLPEICPQHILEFGPGTGQLTRLLSQQFPNAQISAVDVAEKMVAHSREQFSEFPNISWTVGDAQTFEPSTRYPLIVSSSALHWVSNFQQTCSHIFDCLEPGGYFSLGMMLQGTLKELHNLRRQIAPEKTPAITLPTYEETVHALETAGFRLERREHAEDQIIYDDARSFMKALHEQGVTSGKVSAANAPLNRSEITQIIADYQRNHATEGGVAATYETATFLLAKD